MNVSFDTGKIWIIFLIVGTILVTTNGVSLQEDLTISHGQKLILDKFRHRVLSVLPHDYMTKDIYLIRWLRARNFNIGAAQNMLLENLRWRRENKMDTIHQENWDDFESSYKYYNDGHDKDGRPIAFLSFGSWDLRKAAVTGQSDRLKRYIDKAADELTVTVRKEQDAGKNVSQLDFVANLAGYNVIQQGCIQCLDFYIHFVSTYEQHFPGAADKIILLNTPAIFEVVLSAIRPFMSPLTRASLKVYGTNRREWEPILYKDFDRDELPTEVKGNKIFEDY